MPRAEDNKALVARYYDQVLTRGEVAIHVHRVAGGRLAEHWEAVNLLPLLRQLGALG